MKRTSFLNAARKLDRRDALLCGKLTHDRPASRLRVCRTCGYPRPGRKHLHATQNNTPHSNCSLCTELRCRVCNFTYRFSRSRVSIPLPRLRTTDVQNLVVLREFLRWTVAHAASVRQPPLQSTGRTQGCVRYVLWLRAKPAPGPSCRCGQLFERREHKHRLLQKQRLAPRPSPTGSAVAWPLSRACRFAQSQTLLHPLGLRSASRSLPKRSCRSPSTSRRGSAAGRNECDFPAPRAGRG